MIKKLVVVLIGLTLAGVGIGMFLYSGMGVDPASVFQTGLANIFHITYGNASALSNILILIVVFFLDRKYVSIASLIAIVAIGYSADFTAKIISLVWVGDITLLTQLILLLLGTFITGIGVAAYIRGNLGVGAIDMVSEIISDKFHFSYRYVRISIDIAFVIIGYSLGGRVGVGTIVSALLLGPVISLVRPMVHRLVDGFISHS